ncbi:DUF4132 domain-containing protein [Micromonospora sp. RTGN7]|uniref:DUF4132 domain-containing protein n=1 Tax=Micromonospora sp. RTGN7 TaxID=3016526 RepID=UPI0029FF447F|nr:DUF4132 domain-containing protein [Micromonospora sp. RTGN7]
MREFVLPDEGAWVLPASWGKTIHHRRGGHPAPRRAIPPDAAERLRARLRSDKVSRRLERVWSREVVFDPVLLAESQRYLRGWREGDGPGDEMNPVVAGMVALLLGWDDETAACSVDVWTFQYGVEFAARVVGEMTRLVAERAMWSPKPDARHESLWRDDDRNALVPTARLLRARLAVATDGEYERACEILGGYRTSPIGRVVTSYVVPTQVAWVDEDCAAAAGWSAEEQGGCSTWGNLCRLRGLLVLAASTVRHLELLRDHVASPPFLEHITKDPVVSVATVLDAVGLAAVPVLFGPVYGELLELRSRWDRPDGLVNAGVRMLSLIPTGDAFRLLCPAALAGDRARPGALLRSVVMSRYPVLALRILGELATAEPTPMRPYNDKDETLVNPHETAIYRDLVGALVLADPRLLPAAAEALPAAVRAQAEEIVATGGAGIGEGWLGLLDGSGRWGPRRFDSSEEEKRAVAALASVPTDEAFGHLVDRVGRTYFRPALLTAAKRDPRRALRVLLAKSAAAADADETVSELLRNHVLAYPEAAAESLPALDERERARVEAHLSSAAEGPAGVMVPVLAGPPRRPDGKPMRVPEVPEWLVVAALPEVRLRDGGEVLSQDAARGLCALLAVSKINAPHPGIAEVRALCEPHDLAAFAWGVLEQWRAAQYPNASKLAMVALAALGDDTTVPALTSLFPLWATGSSLRVRTGMDVLVAIGSDAALTALHRLSSRAKTEGFRRFAEERIDAVAEARGLSPAQLADRIVPHLGLDADGRTTLDYGPRRFTVGFDEQFQPWVIDQDGKRLARMPRPTAADDPASAAAAQRRFKELRKDVKDIAAARTRALEEAMAVGRRWTGEEFQRLFVHHPLMWQLACRLLWATFDGRGEVVTTFRAAEDRTLADIDDKTFVLDEAATVGLPHSWHFAADRAAWTTIFADYAITQPFPQLTRELISLPGAEADADELSSFVGTEVEARKLYALTAGSWRFNDHRNAVLRDWPDDRTVEIEFSRGFHWQEPDAAQRMNCVRIFPTSCPSKAAVCSCCPRPADPRPTGDPEAERARARFADLGPIGVSEVVRDLRYLAG